MRLWQGIYRPVDVIRDRPDVQDRLNALAITPLTSTPEELEKFIPAEIEKWAKVVKDAGIEPQ